MKYHTLITYLLEIIAAISGFYYLKKNKGSKLRPLVYFLVFTICVEALATYTYFYHLFEILKPIKNTVFKSNFWLYNFYMMACLFFFIRFYSTFLSKTISIRILKLLTGLSMVVVLYYIIEHGIFFYHEKVLVLWNSFAVFLCVALYFYEVLISDKILVFYRLPLFYISCGLLIWWLILPPMLLYMPYYKLIYPEVINIRAFIIIGANVIMYGCFTVGFLWGKEQ